MKRFLRYLKKETREANVPVQHIKKIIIINQSLLQESEARV